MKYSPEALGLLVCLALAGGLRFKGSIWSQYAQNERAWNDIMREWPILLTADTLLAIQAALRLLVLVSNVLRAGGGPTLLSQEAAAISLGAALGRAVLFFRCSDYMLDGPLGGKWPAACELLSVPLLAMLCSGICQRALATSGLTLVVSLWIGSRNHLKLAGDPISDGLFIFVHTTEMLAAFAYLSRAVFGDVGAWGNAKQTAALGFTHFLMPLQQCLAAYYFVQAFECVPQLVGAGHPFEILRMGGVAQVGVYVGAAVLYVAECIESAAAGDLEDSHPSLSAMDVPQHAAAIR